MPVFLTRGWWVKSSGCFINWPSYLLKATMQVRIRFLIRMVWGANWPSAFMIRKVMNFSHIFRVTQQNLSKIFCLYHIIVWIITQTRFHIAVRAKLIAIIPSLSKMNALFMRLFVFISRRLNFALAVAHSKWLWMI